MLKAEIKVCLLLAGSAAGSSAGIVFTHGPILRFFAPQGRHIAPIKVKFGREERTVELPAADPASNKHTFISALVETPTLQHGPY